MDHGFQTYQIYRLEVCKGDGEETKMHYFNISPTSAWKSGKALFGIRCTPHHTQLQTIVNAVTFLVSDCANLFFS
jgi:hypothetical protein